VRGIGASAGAAARSSPAEKGGSRYGGASPVRSAAVVAVGSCRRRFIRPSPVMLSLLRPTRREEFVGWKRGRCPYNVNGRRNGEMEMGGRSRV